MLRVVMVVAFVVVVVISIVQLWNICLLWWLYSGGCELAMLAIAVVLW